MKRLVLCLLLAGCSRDLTLPAEPGPGSISGRAVYAVPGQATLKPAARSVVTLIGAGLSATANQAGTFRLEPIEQTEGLLHFTFDSDGDGVIDLQKIEQLSDWSTGRLKQVAMGDVVLAENAAVRGRVLLADKPGVRTGLGGSAVYVPAGPFAAVTADDGSFTLPNLPSGPLQFSIYRQGYTPKALGTVVLRSGEDYAFKDTTLSVSTEPPGTGAISGTFVFSPASGDLEDTAIASQSAVSMAIPGVVTQPNLFKFMALPEGLYTLTATRNGYTRARVFNVLVLAMKEATVGAVLLTDVPEVDAGQPPLLPDGGPLCVGAGCTPCTTNVQCALNEWCDNNLCAPQCSPTVVCSGGRACDSATKTCVTPCTAGCPTGQQCAANICRASCDGSFMCPGGFKCDMQNACVPECVMESDCAGAFKTCAAGQCVPKGTCGTDLDCPSAQMCLLGLCAARPTARSDGGASPFLCTTACHCKVGEWCTQGLCLPDAVPTRYFANDGDGGGLSPLAASSDFTSGLAAAQPDDVLALKNQHRFYAAAGYGVPANRVTIAGGYEVCAPQRWVRSDTGRTTLASDAGTVVRVTGTAVVPRDDVRLRSLNIEQAADYGCDDDAVVGFSTRRLELSSSDGVLPATSPCSLNDTNSILDCTNCEALLVSDLTVKSSNARANNLAGITLKNSSGVIQKLVSQKQSAAHAFFAMVFSEAQSGPLTVRNLAMPEVSSSSGAVGVEASNCDGQPLVVERSTFTWGRTTGGAAGGVFGLIKADQCNDVQVRDCTFDGSMLTAPLDPGSSGIHLNGGGGVIERNTIKLPKATSSSALAGVYSYLSSTVVTVRDNLILGGASALSVTGIDIDQATVPTVISGNTIDIGPTLSGRGVRFNTSPGGFQMTDNFSRAQGNKLCGSTATGLEISTTSGVIERNRLLAVNAKTTRAMDARGSVQLEVYSSQLWAGRADCAGESSAVVLSALGQIFLGGNTLDVDADPMTQAESNGLWCLGALVVSDGNIVNSGKANTRFMVKSTNPLCVQPFNYTRTYFWHDHPVPTVMPLDEALNIVQADAGVVDARGNYLAQNVSPFDVLQPDAGLPRTRLAAGSLAVDRGRLPKRLDNTNLWLDLEQRPRDAGASADLGCCERY